MGVTKDQLLESLPNNPRVLRRGLVQVTTSSPASGPGFGVETVDITDITARVANPAVFAWWLGFGLDGNIDGFITLPLAEPANDLTTKHSINYGLQETTAGGGVDLTFYIVSTSYGKTFDIYYVVTSMAIALDESLLTS